MGEMNRPRATRTFEPRLLVVVPLAIAAVLLLVWYRPRLAHLFRSASDMEAVVAAAAPLDYRPTLARLSANFSYRNVKPAVRGVDDAGSVRNSAALWALIERLQKQNGQRHALGVSYLLVGRPKDAVASLEQTLRSTTNQRGELAEAIRRSRDAALLNDLAVTYLAVGDPTLQPLVLEAVQRAWTIEQRPAVAWTRAVVIDSYHIREQSIAAWRDYLALESRSEWSDYARQRLDELRQPTDAELWPAARARLLAAGNDDSALFRDVDRFRQEVRLLCEDELLPKWGDAVLRGDPSAASLLAKIAALANALERASGEREVAEAVAAIRKIDGAALRELAKGHVAYGEGRRAEHDSKIADAVREMGIAVVELDPQRTPFAWRARVEHAGMVYLSNDYAGALAELQRLRNDGVARFSNACRGEIHALLGILAVHAGSYEEAADEYARGIHAFQSAGERDYEATLLGRLADALDLTGDSVRAHAYRQQALQLVESLGDRKHKHDIMIGAAYATMGSDQQAVADLFFDALVANDTAGRNDVTACTSLMWRSAYRYHRRLVDGAAADLADAQRVCRSIADRSQRERALANLEVAKSALGSDASSTEPLTGLDEAIRFYQKTDSRVWLSTAYFARARRLWKRDELAAADRDFHDALAESDISREKIDERRLRISFTATADEVTDGYIEFLLQQRREQEAFELADQRRLRELVDSPTARWRSAGASLPDIQASMPLGTVLIEYRVLSKNVVAWIVAPDRLATIPLSVSIEELEPAIKVLESGTLDTNLTASASLLYDGLIRPIEPLLKDVKTLVVVPDDDLERVAYGGLYDSVRRRALIQNTAVVIAPSAGLFEQSRQRWRERSASEGRLVVVQAASGGSGVAMLPEAAKEAQSICGLYPGARIVDGTTATAESFLSRTEGASVLQFVGHSVIDADPSSRALRLGESQQSRVGMQDILGAAFPALRLVYLSACETDRGPILKSEGSMSIARTFFAAGVPTVVGTLWPIDDAAARLAARTFHEHLLRGDTPAEALRQAQLSLLLRGWPFRDWATLRVIGAGI